jgi:hypothetical protein
MSASQYRSDTQHCSAVVRTQSDSDNDAVVPLVWGSPTQCAKRKREFCVHPVTKSGRRWRSWLRHCASSRKVAVVIGIFPWHNPSGRTMVLGLPQPLTEVSTRNISWGVKLSVRTADNLSTFMYQQLSWNLGASTSWNPLGLSRPVIGLLYLWIRREWLRRIAT